MKRSLAAKPVLASLLAVACTVALAGCSNPLEAIGEAFASPTVEEARSQRAAAATPAVSSPSVLEDGVLTVGLNRSSSAPMCMTDQTGSYQGYDVDMAYALGDELGLTVKLVSVSSTSSSLGSECDVVMGETSGRSNVTVAGSYAEDAIGFFHKGDETVASNMDLRGKRIGVQEGSSSAQYLKRSDLNATEQDFQNLNDAFDALDQGIVDYVLCDAFSGAFLSGSYDGIAFAGSINAPSMIGVGVMTSNTDLQMAVKDALDKISSNGVGDVIRARWLGGLSPLTDSSQISGITLSAGTVEGSESDSSGIEGVTSGIQDGSTAGANAADVY